MESLTELIYKTVLQKIKLPLKISYSWTYEIADARGLELASCGTHEQALSIKHQIEERVQELNSLETDTF